MDERAMVLRGATLFDGSAATLQHASVVVRAGRVLEVGQQVPLPPDQHHERLELRGGFLVPGLIDAHVHAEEHETFAALLAAGVTTIRNPALRDTDRPPDTGVASRPTVLAAGQAIDSAASSAPWTVRVRDAAEMQHEVRRQAAAGAALIKLYVGLLPELVRAGVDAAHAAGLRAVGDLVQTSWTDAARAGIDYLCHLPRHPSLLPETVREAYQRDVADGDHPVCRFLELVDPRGREVGEMVETLARAGVAVDPTLVSLEAMLFAGDPEYHAQAGHSVSTPLAGAELQALRRRAGPAWRAALALVEAMHRGGVTLLAGTDAPRPSVAPGRSLHRELTLLASAGLSAREVLFAATGACAAALGLAEVGAVLPGRRADLVLLDRDPLADLANVASIRWVMLSGQRLSIRRPP